MSAARVMASVTATDRAANAATAPLEAGAA